MNNQGSYSLVILSGSLSGTRINLVNQVKAGRNPGNDISFIGVEASLVSGYHAFFSEQNGTLTVTDAGSTNGTFVNGQPVSSITLKNDDIVSLGLSGPKMRIVFQSDVNLNTKCNINPGALGNQPIYGEAGNYTMGLAKRITDGEANPEEVKQLMRDSDRLSRLGTGDLIDKRDYRMIKTASDTYQNSRKKAAIIIGVISVTAIIVVSILGYQNIKYRRALSDQKQLLGNIAQLKSQLDSRSANPNQYSPGREEMVARLRESERKLMKLRARLQSKDLMKLYKTSLGRDIHRAMSDFGEDDYIVPEIFIRQVGAHIKTWQGHPAPINKILNKIPEFSPLIKSELAKAKLPDAFLYLSIHESGLNPLIVSHAGARGLWQFMPGTARDYGLSVPVNWPALSPDKDERTDPLKSTRAAIKYLKVLIGQFGTVPLAMAAYNAGEGRILRELRKIDDPINNRDFWYIYRCGTLAQETNEYVPKIVATMVIEKNRERYGF